MPALIDDLFLPDGHPAISFAGQTFPKFLPARPEDVPWFEADGRAPAGLDAHAAGAFAARRRRLSELALDLATCQVVLRILRALTRDETLLIEGPPGTSKTSSVELAASLLGLTMVRVSFSRDSDSSEFIGKYVPDEEDGGWRWQDGPVPRAMRDGSLLYLDEVNLARAAHLDRLLPVLEAHATLHLVEHRGEPVEAAATFRSIATINSVEVEGRIPLSRPFRDRTTAYFTAEPDLNAVKAMLKHWVHGRAQGQVSIRGRRFLLPDLPPEQRMAPTLARVTGFEEVLQKLARFHHTAAELARAGDLGRDRREAFSFGRRRLASFVRSLDAELGFAAVSGPVDVRDALLHVLDEHYLDAVEGEDRRALKDQMQNILLNELPPLAIPRHARACRTPTAGAELLVEDLERGTTVTFKGEPWRVRRADIKGVMLERSDRQSTWISARATVTRLADGAVILKEGRS